MNVTERIPKSEFLSKYDHWLLKDKNKSMCQTFNPMECLAEIEKIHTTSVPVAVNNKKTALNDIRLDKMNDDKVINSNRLNYNETLPTSSNGAQHLKRKFQSSETNTESKRSMRPDTCTNTKVNEKFLNIRNDTKVASIHIEIVCFAIHIFYCY